MKIHGTFAFMAIMNQELKKLSDVELLDRTRKLATKERETATEVLWHLKEVSERRLYSARGFSSIFAYAVHELKYSEAAAARRVAAMRLLCQLPEVASEIETGALNLSSVSTAQNFFRREEMEQGKQYSVEEKREILKSMVNQPKRECEKILAAISPESVLKLEKAKPLTQSHSELRIIVNHETLQKFERLRNLLSHQNPSGSYGALLDLIAEMALDRVDPQRIEERAQNRKDRAEAQKNSKVEGNSKRQMTPPEEPGSSKKLAVNSINPRSIPSSVKRQVFLRNEGRCTYKDPLTGKVCGSCFQVELDHVVPVFLGGTSKPENLQTRCKSHNLWEAVSKLGKEIMEPYIGPR